MIYRCYSDNDRCRCGRRLERTVEFFYNGAGTAFKCPALRWWNFWKHDFHHWHEMTL